MRALATDRPDFALPRHRPRPLLRFASAAIAVSTLLAGTVETQTAVANGDTRTISLVHEHTKESATITFKRDGRYDRAALDQLNWLLRDWRESEATKMDPRLFDTVWEAQRAIGSTQPLRVVCGYRSPKTNGMLRRRSSGVAEHSQHTLGKAMDFFMTDASIDDIRATGVRMQRGGVGWYPRSGSPFVHLDVGSVRAWPRMTRDQLVRIFPDGKTVHLPADGKPLARYEEARAEILARGGTVMGQTSVASADDMGDGPGIKSFFAGLFGGGSSSTAGAPVPEATPGKARGRATIAVASADPDDVTGAKQALAFAAPNSSEALREAMLRRERRDTASAKALLTGTTDKPAEAAPVAISPLPPRRPAEFAAVTAALTAPLPPSRPVQFAALGNAGMSGMANTSAIGATRVDALGPVRLIAADADAQDQLRGLFLAFAQNASAPSGWSTPVRLASARVSEIIVSDAVFDAPTGATTRFSRRSPGDDLTAAQFALPSGTRP